MVTIYGHRGASAELPENTLPAFALAKELGAYGIELDVHLSRDGVPVVIHDESVDRTTDGSGERGRPRPCRPAAAGCRQWRDDTDPGRGARPGGGHHACGHRGEGGRGGRCGAGRNRDTVPTCGLRSHHSTTMCSGMCDTRSDGNRALAAHRRGVHRGNCHREGTRCPASRRQGSDAERGNHRRSARANGLEIWVWTVNDPDRAEQLVGWGATGICTDDPRAMLTRFGNRSE